MTTTKEERKISKIFNPNAAAYKVSNTPYSINVFKKVATEQRLEGNLSR